MIEYCTYKSRSTTKCGLFFNQFGEFTQIVDRDIIAHCLNCDEDECLVAPKSYKREVERQEIVEKSVQCPVCLAYEELTFCDGVLEGESRNSHIYTKHWRQKNGVVEHHCLW